MLSAVKPNLSHDVVDPNTAVVSYRTTASRFPIGARYTYRPSKVPPAKLFVCIPITDCTSKVDHRLGSAMSVMPGPLSPLSQPASSSRAMPGSKPMIAAHATTNVESDTNPAMWTARLTHTRLAQHARVKDQESDPHDVGHEEVCHLHPHRSEERDVEESE